ncbi:MAG: methyltransferase domain-containing protein [Candidatus Gastranaerophilales bacterium]|nr:methyltransferase domain-containing protein [Candidatus Gastranaerophilales bacterium]
MIFKISNEYNENKKYKVITLCGIKLKIKVSEKENCKHHKSIYNNIIPSGILYRENLELGLGNITIKQEDEKNGQSFEYEDMIVVNKAIGKYFLKNQKNVINIGAGIGTFEYYNAEYHKNINFVSSELDSASIEYANLYRKKDNVIYCSEDMSAILNKYGKFDLAISVDVIEHVENYKEFLDDFSKLSDEAIIATPNRDRYYEIENLISPPYKYHVQEFNAGELYFILKMYYKDVKLYSLPNPLEETFKEVGIYSQYEKLVAYCKK